MGKILGKDFYNRPTLLVARELLGKFIVLEEDGEKKEKMITEVEAYDGFNDLASHASRGETKRNKIMFAPGGNWYVYLIYGFHYLFNITTGPAGYPAAVLIRGIEGVSGPGRVAKFFGIDKRFHEKPAAKKTGLYIVDKGIEINPRSLKTAPRTGVDYAGPIWSQKKYKFYLDEWK